MAVWQVLRDRRHRDGLVCGITLTAILSKRLRLTPSVGIGFCIIKSPFPARYDNCR